MAGRIPHNFVDEITTRTDIVDIIDSRVPLKKAGSEYKACCPFHDEKTPSFTVSPGKQFYHCFGCGAHGTSIGFLMEYDHMEFVEAIEHLAARLGLEVPREADPHAGKQTDTVDILTMLRQSASYYQKQLRNHPNAVEAIEYLKRRGLTGEVAAHFGLGYAPAGWNNLLNHLGEGGKRRDLLLNAGLITHKSGDRYYDRFRNRIMFPIEDHRGRVVGFGGRSIGDEEPKYLNSPETPVFHKGAELYGLHAARGAIKDSAKALVVEGYMDVLALLQFGVGYAVATLGTATTRTQLERLFRHTDEIVFSFDGDRAGREAAWRALESALPCLREGRQIAFLFLPQGEDPDSVIRKEGKESFEARLEGATPLPEYLLEQIGAQADLSRMDGQARFVELARPLLKKIPQGPFREILIGRIAQMVPIERGALERSLPSGDVPAPRPAPRSAESLKKSLVRLGLSILIQKPALAMGVEDIDELETLEMPGISLMLEVIRLIQENPDLGPASVLERYRNTDHHKHLEKLAIWDHMIPVSDLDQEFEAVILKLRNRVLEQQASRLLHRDSLSADEKSRLRELLSQRPK